MLHNLLLEEAPAPIEDDEEDDVPWRADRNLESSATEGGEDDDGVDAAYAPGPYSYRVFCSVINNSLHTGNKISTK